jgi:hypothetical protein
VGGALYADQARVLSWIQSRKIPEARPVPASPPAPAGIEIVGAEAFGVGIRSSDRLVRVAGAPVADPDAVAAAVIAARNRHAESLTAEFLRPSEAGWERWTLVIAQPYLKP